MNSQLRTALVTGGNKGIGFAICQGLLAKGFEVVIAARSLDKGKAAAEQMQSANDMRVVELDITNDESIRRAAEDLGQQIEHLDVRGYRYLAGDRRFA